MTIVKTNINHNISDLEFNDAISKTSSLIRYSGHEYLKKLKALNDSYIITNGSLLDIGEMAEKIAIQQDKESV
jgi:myosin-crossreactive antigen